MADRLELFKVERETPSRLLADVGLDPMSPTYTVADHRTGTGYPFLLRAPAEAAIAMVGTNGNPESFGFGGTAEYYTEAVTVGELVYTDA